MTFVSVIIHVANRERALKTWAKAWPLLLLLFFIVLSISWSGVPDIAFRRVVKYLMFIMVLAGIVMGASSPREILRLAVVFTGLFMILNCASLVLFPAAAFYKGGWAFQGLHGHKNSAGIFSMISIFVWLSAARLSEERLTKAILYFGVFVWFVFLIGTDSRTSVGATILAISFILPLRYIVRYPSMIVLSGVGLCFVVGLAAYALILFNITPADIIAFLEGDRTTLTGRFIVWDFVYTIFLKHSLLGTGYGSLWSTGDVAPAEIYSEAPLTGFLMGLTHAHNGYLDVMVALGTVGGIVFLVFLGGVGVAVIKTFRSQIADRALIAMAETTGFIFVTTILGNLTRTTFLRLEMEWASFILCYFLLCWMRTMAHPESTPAVRGSAGVASKLGALSEIPATNR